MDDLITFGLALGGALLFGAIPGLPAGLGWFIGMTAGQLLSLESETSESTTVGPRRTEFRGLNSRFGIPIAKGYGTVRLNGNIIWASPVTEDALIERNCISQQSGGFFGFFDREVETCSTVVTYHYKQSFAVAFAQGPCTSYIRIWASGNTLLDNSPSNAATDAQDSAATGRPESTAGPAALMTQITLSEYLTVTANTTLRFYYGTATQGVDPAISLDVGAANCPAFRNTCYILIDELDLERWGYRLPEITAEISFTAGDYNPTHVSRNNTEYPDDVQWDRWSPEIPMGDPNVNYIVTNGFEGITGTNGEYLWRFTDIYTGDHYQIFDWQPVLDEFHGTATNPTETGPEWGKVDYRGWWYFSGMMFGFAGPYLYQYDPIRGAIQQYGTSNEIGTWWISHILHDQPRGLMYCVSSILGNFCVLVSNRTTYALNNALSIPEDDGIPDLFQVIFPAQDFNATGAMAMDRNGIIWIGTTSNNTLYKYEPDLNVISSITLSDPSSPSGTISSIQGITYVWRDESLVLLCDIDLDTTSVIKFDLATETVTLANRSLNPTWEPNAVTVFGTGPHEGGVYNYTTGPSTYYRLNLIDLTQEELHDYGDFDQPNSQLSAIYIPQIRAFFNTTQQIDYLRITGGDEDLANIVADLILKDDVVEDRYGITNSDLDLTDLVGTNVRGFSVTSQQSIRGALTSLQQGFFFDYVESDAQLLFRLRGRSSIVTIPEDHLGAHEYGTKPKERLKITYREELELPRELAVNYIDQNRNYEQGTQRYRRLKTNASSNTTVTVPIVFVANEAQEVAEVLHSDAWTEREVFQFSLGPTYLFLDPTDNITIDLDDGSSHFIRITKTIIGRNGIIMCEGVADKTSLYSAPNAIGIEGGFIDPGFLFIPVRPYPVVPAIPQLTVTNDDFNLYVGAVGYDSNNQFQGADVYVQEGYSLRYAGTIDTLATSGSITAEVEHPDNPAGYYGSIDSEQTISLVTTPTTLSSVTEEQLFSGSNLAVFGDEVIAFQTVSANSPDTGNYTLSNIIRGLNGTDHNVDRHVFPETFILASELISIPMTETQLNQAVTIVLRPKGSTSQIIDVIEYQGASAAPLAPTDPQVISSGSPEDYVFSWTRRDRTYGAWSYLGEIPTSETIESYEVDILDRDANVLRTLSVSDAQTVTYTNANMVTDFGSVPPTMYAILYQLSETIGRGFPRRFVARPNGEYYFRNFFSDLSSPVTTPANVSQRWVTSGYTYNVESDITSDYGAVLHLNTSTDGRHLLSLDDLGELRDVELLIRFKVPAFGAASGGAGARFIVRGRGAAATEKGLYLGINADGSSFNLNKYNNGTAVAIGTATNISSLPHLAGFSNNLQDNVWYRCRLRVTGWRYKFKIWRDDTNEPGTWDAEYYDSMTHEFGWTGVGGFESYIDVKFDWIYAAINGKRAG